MQPAKLVPKLKCRLKISLNFHEGSDDEEEA
jgi:hypothetical protein